MGERRVSESPPRAQRPPARAGGEAGGIARAGVTQRSLESRKASVGTYASGGQAAPGPAGSADPSLEGRADSESGFLAINRRLRRLRSLPRQYSAEVCTNIHGGVIRALERLSRFVLTKYENSGGDIENLIRYDRSSTLAEQAYESLQQQADQAETAGDTTQASAIHRLLNVYDQRAAAELQRLSPSLAAAGLPFTPAPQRTPETAVPQWDWCTTYQRLRGIHRYFSRAGRTDDALRFINSVHRLEHHVRQRFETHAGKRRASQIPYSPRHSKPEQKYLILKEMASRTQPASGATKRHRIHQDLESVDRKAHEEVRLLTTVYGPLEVLAARAGLTGRQAPAIAGPGATHAAAQLTVAPPPLRTDPAPGPVPAETRLRREGPAALPSISELLSEPPGPSSGVPPPRAAQTPMAPAREVPLEQRQAIAARLRSEEAVINAGFALGSSATDALGWDATRVDRVLHDLGRLNTFAGENPTALAGIDWTGIEALLRVTDNPPASP